MILRNGVEIKKINEEFSRLSLLLDEMSKANVSKNDLLNLQTQIENGLIKVATYMDKIDKVWVNKDKMRTAYTKYDSLIERYGQAKLQIARAGINVNYESTDSLWITGEDHIKSNIMYLNNANNSRTKDRVHYFATRGLALVLAGALMVGGGIAINKYNDAKNDLQNQTVAVETLKDENQQLQEDIKNLQAQIADLEKQLENAGSPEEAEKLRAEIEDLKAQLGEMISLKEYNDLLALQQKTQKELDDAKKEVNSLKQQLQNAGSSEEAKELREKLQKAEDKVAELEGKLANYDALVAENAELRAQKSALEGSLEDANDKIADLEKQLEEAKNANDSEKIKALEEQLKEANKVKADLEASLEEANKKIGKLEDEIKKVNKENEELKQENEELREENKEGNELKQNIDSLYAELFGNDGAGKTASEKYVEIYEFLVKNDPTSDGSGLRAGLVDIIVNTYYLPYSEVNSWTDEQIMVAINAIYGELANAGDGPTNGNVNEEKPSTPENGGTQTPEEDPISPDHGIVHE